MLGCAVAVVMAAASTVAGADFTGADFTAAASGAVMVVTVAGTPGAMVVVDTVTAVVDMVVMVTAVMVMAVMVMADVRCSRSVSLRVTAEAKDRNVVAYRELAPLRWE